MYKIARIWHTQVGISGQHCRTEKFYSIIIDNCLYSNSNGVGRFNSESELISACSELTANSRGTVLIIGFNRMELTINQGDVLRYVMIF